MSLSHNYSGLTTMSSMNMDIKMVLPLNWKLSIFFQAPSASPYNSVTSGCNVEVTTFLTFVSLETSFISQRSHMTRSLLLRDYQKFYLLDGVLCKTMLSWLESSSILLHKTNSLSYLLKGQCLPCSSAGGNPGDQLGKFCLSQAS